MITCKLPHCEKIPRPGRKLCSMHETRFYKYNSYDLLNHNNKKATSEEWLATQRGVWDGVNVLV